MSVDIERIGAGVILEAAAQASAGDLSDVEMDGDGDRSSSLSEIEYKDSHQEEDADSSDDQINNSEEENDSEAETERLEDSPNKIRSHKDVVLSSHSSQIYERSPSKLQNQMIPTHQLEEEDDDDEPLSDEEISPNDSSKSSTRGDVDADLPTAPTSLEDSAGEGKRTLSITDADSRKRKRSIMAGGGLDEDVEEPLRKRTGSVMLGGDDYAIDDEEQVDEEADGDVSNPISGNISGDEGGEVQEDRTEEADLLAASNEEIQETVDVPVSPKKRGRKKKKTLENGLNLDDDPQNLLGAEPLNGEDAQNGGDDGVQNEGVDEAEAALRNEEELERKRIALEQLSIIEKQFATFRDRLFEERMEALNREEAMLREDKPTHPEYLAMLQIVDERRDERIRIAERTREYELQALQRSAVAGRSQILVQFKQEIRDIRERTIEQLGNQWYEIQHDRRSYAGSVPDYTLKFPTRRSHQVSNQVAYSNEVSILSGVAKYVGFPSAPVMAKATNAELLEDLEKMGRTRQPQPFHAAAGLHELAALRTAGATRSKPAEEKFIEQTPWANPLHPSHAHLLQRQASTQQAPRTKSPFSHSQSQPRRYSHQPSVGAGPVSGTFSSSSLHPVNGHSNVGGSIPPHNPFSNSATAPSPLGSRHPSLSPQENRQAPIIPGPQLQHTPAGLINGLKSAGSHGE